MTGAAAVRHRRGEILLLQRVHRSGGPVTAAVLIAAIAFGAALLAVWSYLRWPGAAPNTIASAILHAILAFGALQVAAIGLGRAAASSDYAAELALILVVLPALTYAFLAALWVMRLFAASLKGVG